MTGAATATYAYEALRADGHAERGTVSAASPAEAVTRVGDLGLLPVSVRITATRRERRARISTQDLALGLRVLADLLDAGLPLARALASLEELAPASWRPAIPAIINSIREGRTLAAALDEAPIAIPPVVTGIARAGEAGAGLGAAIRRAAEHTESVAATTAAVRSALAYPAVVAVAGCASLGLMIGVVLPRFARILADLGQALPASTRLVLAGAELAHALLVPGILAGIAIAVIVNAWHSTESGRRTIDRLLLGTPVVGAVRLSGATARSLSALGAMLESGVPIRQALFFAARSSGDAEFESRVLGAREHVARGQSLAIALRECHAGTPTAVRLVRSGEESGRVAGMLLHAARIEQEYADRLIRTAVRFLEPALILVFAGVIGVVATALLQAVYSVRPT